MVVKWIVFELFDFLLRWSSKGSHWPIFRDVRSQVADAPLECMAKKNAKIK